MRTIIDAASIGLKNLIFLLLSGLTWWLWQSARSHQSDYDWLYYAGAGLCAYIALQSLYQLIQSIQLYTHQLTLRYEVSQTSPHPRQGDGAFLSENDLDKLGYLNANRASLTGAVNGRPFFVPFVHCLVIAPPGSGKTTSKVIPALCHGYRTYHPKTELSRVASLVTTDLKWENYPMSARLRRDQHRQKTIILNPSHPDTARYEPLDLVIEAMKESNIPKAITIAETFAHILEPEPAQDDAKNKFWRLGPRLIILYCILYVCESDQDKASLILVTDLVSDGERLWQSVEANAQSSAFNGELAKQAQTIQSMGKYFLEHLLTARFDLQSFGGGRQVAACLGASDFRWRDLKQRGMAVYIGGKLSEQKPLKTWLKLMLECLCMELQDEQNGGNIPVDILLEEATNFGFDISDKLAALRGQGGRVTLIVQSLSELERVYGKHPADTIWNLTDLKIIIGGSHDVALANKISAILGFQHVYKPNYAAGYAPADNIRENTAEDQQPLLTPHEIMNLKGQLVLVQSVGNILCEKLTYDRVKPWPRWLDDNPIEGGKLSGKPTITLSYRKKRKGLQKVRVVRFKHKKAPKSARKTPPRWLNTLWLGFTALYLACGFVLWNMDDIYGRSPHMLWNYSYQGHLHHKRYISCQYFGIDGERLLHFPRDCPFIRMIAHRPSF